MYFPSHFTHEETGAQGFKNLIQGQKATEVQIQKLLLLPTNLPFCNKDALHLLVSDNLREEYFVIGILISYYQDNNF